MNDNKKTIIRNSTAEFLMFSADARQDGIEVRFENKTVWLSQKMVGNLFDCSTDNISLHLKNIFKDAELDKKSVIEDFSVTAKDGKNKAESEFEKYRIVQDRLFVSDFDRLIDEQLKELSDE